MSPGEPSWWKRRVWKLPIAAWIAIVLVLLVIGAVGSATFGKADLDKANETISNQGSAIADLESQLATKTSDAEAAERARADAVSEAAAADEARVAADAARTQAESERDAATARAEAAERERDAVLLQFDPQIQAQLVELQGQAESEACAKAQAAGATGGVAPSGATALASFYQSIPDAVTQGREPSSLFDQAPIDLAIQNCHAQGVVEFEAAQAAEAAAEQQQVLFGPRGDGFYTVGLEMGPGRWRSKGNADDCYWERHPDGNPEDIIDNHFGQAGGTVTVNAGEEFQTKDCGLWEFVG